MSSCCHLQFSLLNPSACDHAGQCVTASSPPALVDASPPYTGNLQVAMAKDAAFGQRIGDVIVRYIIAVLRLKSQSYALLVLINIGVVALVGLKILLTMKVVLRAVWLD